jgi:predicted ester cyclase
MEEIMPGENKAIAHRWTEEIWNQGSMAAIDEIVAAEIVQHIPPLADLQGIDALKQFLVAHRATFPDGRFTEDDLIEEGDKVAFRWTFRATHMGEYLGVAATGLPTDITGTTTLRIAQGKVAEHWTHFDALGWMQWAGAVTTALIHRWFEEVMNKGKLEVIDEIWARDGVFTATLIPEARGPEAVKQVAAAVLTATPDIHYSLVGEPVVQGDRCSCRWTAGGTHRGDLFGIGPTGRYLTHHGTATFRVREGKIAECWAEWDALDLMQQLGVAPAVGQLKAAA